MRRLVMAATALLAIVCAGPFLVREWRDARAWARIRDGGVLRVGIDPSAKPYSFYSADGWAGYEADLAHALAAELNLTLTVISVGYDGRYDSLVVDQVDVFMSASTPEGGRPEHAWSDVYLDVGPRLLVRTDSSVESASDLEGRRVSVARGGAADRTARYWQRRVANVSRMAAAEDAAAVRALRTGDVDGAFVSGAYALRIGCPLHGTGRAEQGDGLWCIAVAPEPYAVLMRARDVRLRSAIDAALERIRLGNLPRAWRERWFEGD